MSTKIALFHKRNFVDSKMREISSMVNGNIKLVFLNGESEYYRCYAYNLDETFFVGEGDTPERAIEDCIKDISKASKYD